MKIEFMIDGEDHRATFEALTDMLDVLERSTSISNEVCVLMDVDEEYLEDIVSSEYTLDGFNINFTYIKKTGKISLISKRVRE